MFAEFTELFSVHRCTGRQWFTSLADWKSSICSVTILFVKYKPLTTNEAMKIRALRIKAATFITRLTDDLFKRANFTFFNLLVMAPKRLSTIFLNRYSPNYFAADNKVRGSLSLIIITQFCYTAKADAMSFLHSSYGRPQVQTAPSSAWDAPCPVVTPSLKGLGSAFSVFTLWKY